MMKNKQKNILWIVSLLLISSPAGLITIFTEKPYSISNEFALNLIVGGVACVFVLGAISAGAFMILKKLQKPRPLKGALQTYTFIVIAMLLIGIFRLPGAIKDRGRNDFLNGLKPMLNNKFAKKIKEQPNVLQPQITTRVQEICICICFGLQKNEELLDSIIAAKDPKAFVLNSRTVKKITADCIGLYME